MYVYLFGARRRILLTFDDDDDDDDDEITNLEWVFSYDDLYFSSHHSFSLRTLKYHTNKALFDIVPI